MSFVSTSYCIFLLPFVVLCKGCKHIRILHPLNVFLSIFAGYKYRLIDVPYFLQTFYFAPTLMEFLIIISHQYRYKLCRTRLYSVHFQDLNRNSLVSKNVNELDQPFIELFRYCHFGFTTSTWILRVIEGHKMFKTIRGT